MLCFLSACVQRFECFLYHKINSCLFHFVCFNVGGLFLFSIFSELHRRFIKYFMNKNFSLWMDLWSAKFSNLGCFFFFFFLTVLRFCHPWIYHSKSIHVHQDCTSFSSEWISSTRLVLRFSKFISCHLLDRAGNFRYFNLLILCFLHGR